ncbi:unnamed protein product [Paramecium octaurelia]|uniref:RING-type domain-containing protein n=1 Tax=Paramecium octaurelia TaxID=43137 RepID=A0A8S1TN31_PAROT|nr:unnamed protein product [Paramecium octaurelia]
MGCLFTMVQQQKPLSIKSNKVQEEKLNDQNIEEQPLNQQFIHIEFPLTHVEEPIMYIDVPLIQDDNSDLLTDTSLDKQEIQQIDESIKLRKIQLMKIKACEKFKRHNSLLVVGTIYEEEKKKQRAFSQNKIINKNISINNFYYQKFLSQYKAFEQPLDQQKNMIHQNIDQIDQEIREEIFSQENSFSSLKSLVSLCKYCTNEIQEGEYQLECFHCYHAKCLEELIINQIEKDQTLISCLCHQSIKTKLIKQILLTNNEKYEHFLEKQSLFLKSILQ